MNATRQQADAAARPVCSSDCRLLVLSKAEGRKRSFELRLSRAEPHSEIIVQEITE